MAPSVGVRSRYADLRLQKHSPTAQGTSPVRHSSLAYFVPASERHSVSLSSVPWGIPPLLGARGQRDAPEVLQCLPLEVAHCPGTNAWWNGALRKSGLASFAMQMFRLRAGAGRTGFLSELCFLEANCAATRAIGLTATLSERSHAAVDCAYSGDNCPDRPSGSS